LTVKRNPALYIALQASMFWEKQTPLVRRWLGDWSLSQVGFEPN